MDMLDQVVVVHRQDGDRDNDHGINHNWGITAKSAGSQGISMASGEVPPGIKAEPHWHPFETAIHITDGSVRVLYGDQLEHQIDVSAGDFLLIPAYVVHSPYNISNAPMRFIVARNAPEEIAFTPDEKSKLKRQSDM
jgi:uncharacterized RmlC-like cupin family protein